MSGLKQQSFTASSTHLLSGLAAGLLGLAGLIHVVRVSGGMASPGWSELEQLSSAAQASALTLGTKKLAQECSYYSDDRGTRKQIQLYKNVSNLWSLMSLNIPLTQESRVTGPKVTGWENRRHILSQGA